MTTHPTARAITEDTNEPITGSLQNIARMFTEMSTELGRFSEQVLSRLAGTDTAQPDEHRQPSEGSARSDGRPPPTSAKQEAPVPLPGEPVDTSFARPIHTPVAMAAGVSPPQEPFQQATPQAAEAGDGQPF